MALAAGALLPTLVSARQSTTVWTGVYTEAQAKRGQQAYRQHCTYCHHEDLLGGEDLAVVPPALVGAAFAERWQGETVGAMLRVLADTMPWNRARLTPQIYADVLSYLFKENEFPAGMRELSADPSLLDQILITAKP